LNKEIKKKSDIGKKVLQEKHKENYIADEIIIQLVEEHILALEKE